FPVPAAAPCRADHWLRDPDLSTQSRRTAERCGMVLALRLAARAPPPAPVAPAASCPRPPPLPPMGGFTRQLDRSFALPGLHSRCPCGRSLVDGQVAAHRGRADVRGRAGLDVDCPSRVGSADNKARPDSRPAATLRRVVAQGRAPRHAVEAPYGLLVGLRRR